MLTNATLRWLVSGIIVTLAAGAVLAKYWDYVVNPWTRNGQVMAQVIQINPRVSGPLIQLPIEDNQFVRKGELLFEIDPRTFQAAFSKSEADLKTAQVKLDNARNDERRYRGASADRPGAVSAIELELKIDDRRAAEAEVLASEAALESARLDLEFTRFLAPVDGYVTNLTLRLGSQAVANQALLALVDVNSFWVHGYFRETVIGDMAPGDEAIITLMTYPDIPLSGRVESLGWGIAQQDGSAGDNLLPDVSPAFEWIRLAQRVPVRIRLEDVPENVALRVGTTASVLVRTRTAGQRHAETAVALPRPLQ